MTATRPNTHRAPGRAVAFRGARVAPKVAAATGGAVVVAGLGLVGTQSATAAGTVWDEVAQCESGGNWSINTGNGYYGGLQFSDRTWDAYGGEQYASTADQATKSQQIAIGERVLEGQGAGAWPNCGGPLSGGAGHCSLAGPVEPTYFNQFIILYSPVIDKGKQDQFSVNSAHRSLRSDGVRRFPGSKKPSGPRALEGISLSWRTGPAGRPPTQTGPPPPGY